jgi:hypothetical protein
MPMIVPFERRSLDVTGTCSSIAARSSGSTGGTL